jgi:DNA-nicking Smr family endonuclease
MAKDLARTKGLKSLKRAAAAIAAARGDDTPADAKFAKAREPVNPTALSQPKPQPVPQPRDDGELFAQAMADVKRIVPDRRGDRVRARPLAGALSAPVADTKAGARAAAGSAEAADAEDEAAYAAPGVDRRELRKLKRGDYEPGDSLDVHGLTAAEALAAVRRFLDRSRARYRCVAVIHGRGLRSPGHVAVLKSRVRVCLREHRQVLAFSDAPPDAGGPGAVYVLLRR